MTRNIPLELGWEALYLADEAPGFGGARGRSLAAVAAERGSDPFDLYFDLIASSGGAARIVNDGYGGDAQDERPLRRLVARRDSIPETDTAVVPEGGRLTLPLPMFWGTMPRFLGHFSRDLQLISLPEAVRRMTGLPARRARLTGRGELTTGAYADLVLLDLDELGDRGTFLDPEQPGGVEWVFVNGKPVVRERSYDPSDTPGRALRVGQG